MKFDKNIQLFIFSLIPVTSLYLFGLFSFNMNKPLERGVSKQAVYNSYNVIGVCDGDTVVLGTSKPKSIPINFCAHMTKLPADVVKVRLLGIDAFEATQNNIGKEGKAFLQKVLLNNMVLVETDINKEDKYKRLLGYVFLTEKDKEVFINEEIIKNGYGLIYLFPPNLKYADVLKDAQEYAKTNMLGIWKNQNYIQETPSEYRKRKKH